MPARWKKRGSEPGARRRVFGLFKPFAGKSRRATGVVAPMSPVKRLFLLTAVFGALGAGVFAVAGTLFWQFYFKSSDLFCIQSLEQVSVEGTESLAPDTVLELMGIRKGMNLFAFDTVAARTKLLASAPQVKGTEIQLYLPHEIRIRIVEREPVAGLYQPGFAVDDEGVVFRRRGISSAFPVIVGMEGYASVEPGARLSAFSLPMAAVRLAIAMSQQTYSFRVRQIDIRKSDYYLTLTMEDQRRAKLAWSGMDDAAKDSTAHMLAQLSFLSAAMKDENSRNRLMFNATVPGYVAAAE